MKSFLKIVLLAVPLLLSGCDWFDDDGGIGVPRPPKGFDAGQIYDYDLTKCGCCGGYMIRINHNEYKFFNEDVSGSNPLNAIDIKYPLNVYLKWSMKPGDCSKAGRIVVHELRIGPN